MITATIKETKKVKGVTTERTYIKCYHSLDKVRNELAPIARAMEAARQKAKKTNTPYVDPPTSIKAVSFDTKSEKNLLLEMRAIVTTENEEE